MRTRDSARPSSFGLSSPTALALRGERGTLAGWLLGTGFFALIIGLISTTVSNGALSSSLRRQLQKVGDVSFTTPSGYVGLCFLFFVLAVSLFACSQLAAARREESEERLGNPARAFSRSTPLAGWASRACAGRSARAVARRRALRLARRSHPERPYLDRQHARSRSELPAAALLFLGIAALAFALHPRSSAGVAYGLVAAGFLWQLFGGLLEAPHWALDLSPFEHIGLVPAQPFRAADAAAMLGLATATSAAAVWAFTRRDLTGQ